jgi:hypothetical protein
MTRIVYPDGGEPIEPAELIDVPAVDVPLAPLGGAGLPAAHALLAPRANGELQANSAIANAGLSPDERANRTAIYWHSTSAGLFACGTEVEEAWRVLDQAGKEEYVAGLVQRAMLTKREAADPQGSAKLSRLRKVARHEDVLNRPEVLLRVGASLSKLDLCASIFEEAEGAVAEKRQKLIDILENCPNEEVDRAYLAAAHKALKRAQNPPPEHDHAPTDAADGATTWSSLRDNKSRFDRVLITPRPADMRRFAKSLAHPERIEEQLPLRDVLAKNAVIVIAAEVSDLPRLVEYPALRCGIKGPPSVFLARRPMTAEISKAPILIALERGDVESSAAGANLWIEGGEVDFAAMAAHLYPGGQWLHVFAGEEQDGFTSLIGDHGWVDASELSK